MYNEELLTENSVLIKFNNNIRGLARARGGGAEGRGYSAFNFDIVPAGLIVND